MRTPEEIKEAIDFLGVGDTAGNYKYIMLEIMCNIAITLDKIAKEINDE